jgi:hypothetical protein
LFGLTVNRDRARLAKIQNSTCGFQRDNPSTLARLFQLSRREKALEASQEAVDIYRRLAQNQPDAFLSDLAVSLNNLGIRLISIERRWRRPKRP